MKFPSSEWDKISLMISQHWFRQWLGAVRHQAITWANVDQGGWCRMVSLGHNELKAANVTAFRISADYKDKHELRHALMILTLTEQGQNESGQTRLISWLLMPWVLSQYKTSSHQYDDSYYKKQQSQNYLIFITEISIPVKTVSILK